MGDGSKERRDRCVGLCSMFKALGSDYALSHEEKYERGMMRSRVENCSTDHDTKRKGRKPWPKMVASPRLNEELRWIHWRSIDALGEISRIQDNTEDERKGNKVAL